MNKIITKFSGAAAMLLATACLSFTASGQTQDYGDAPSSYDAAGAASHTVVSDLYMGTSSIDLEFAPASNSDATGDNNTGIDDEEAVVRLPTIYSISPNTSVQLNNVYNNTGRAARLIGWIDFNRDGDFDDAGERSQIVTVASGITGQTIAVNWRNIPTGTTTAGTTFLRVRLTLDSTGTSYTNPLPTGSQNSGEVEDYSVTILPLSQQPITLLDSFTSAESNFLQPPPPGRTIYSRFTKAGVSNIIGGERDVYQTAAGTGTVTLIIDTKSPGTPGSISIGNSLASTSRTTITYDGPDHQPATLDPTGLNGIDLSLGTYIYMDYAQDLPDGSDTITIRIYSDATHWSETVLGAPKTGLDRVRLFFPFSTFTTGAGAAGPMDLRKVGAVQIEFNALSGADPEAGAFGIPQPKRDYGDARATYEAGLNGAASHLRNDNIKMGALIDTNSGPSSSLLANGDDLNSLDDEDGIVSLPVFSTLNNSVSVTVSNVLNQTDTTAACVGWIDFNNDGDFNDANEQSAVALVTRGASTSNVTLSWTPTLSQIVSSRTNMRLRLTTDNISSTSSNWFTAPSYGGYRADGEIEDYLITILQADGGDVLGYPTAQTYVNPDENNDGMPDLAGSVWLGKVVDGEVTNLANATANGDDLNKLDDEDGVTYSNAPVAGQPITFYVNANHQGAGLDAATIGLWVDWNGNGSFNDAADFFTTQTVNFTGAGQVASFIATTVPATLSTNYVVRAAIAPSGTVTYTKSYAFTGIQESGEFEDYLQNIVLPINLLYFDARRSGSTAVLNWGLSETSTPESTEITRSSDGINFSGIGRVPAMSGAQRYTYTDNSPLPGTNYYRLKVNDISGEFRMTNIAQVRFTSATSALWAQGGQSEITLRHAGADAGAGYVIYSSKGQVIASGKIGSGATVRVPVAMPGIYIVTFTDEQGASLDRVTTTVIQ